MDSLILRELVDEDEDAFFEGMKEWAGESPHWYSFAWKDGMTFKQMLTILRDESLGIGLAPDRVPHTMLYAFLDGRIIGRVSVRHSLNEYLIERGGHVGYAVAPRWRGQGFATRMMELAMPFIRRLGLEEILVT